VCDLSIENFLARYVMVVLEGRAILTEVMKYFCYFPALEHRQQIVFSLFRHKRVHLFQVKKVAVVSVRDLNHSD